MNKSEKIYKKRQFRSCCPGICLTAEENPGKPQLGDCLVKAVQPVIATNGITYLQMNSVGFYCSYGKNKKRKGREGSNYYRHITSRLVGYHIAKS